MRPKDRRRNTCWFVNGGASAPEIQISFDITLKRLKNEKNIYVVLFILVCAQNLMGQEYERYKS